MRVPRFVWELNDSAVVNVEMPLPHNICGPMDCASSSLTSHWQGTMYRLLNPRCFPDPYDHKLENQFPFLFPRAVINRTECLGAWYIII
jgi:hypothetical protein